MGRQVPYINLNDFSDYKPPGCSKMLSLKLAIDRVLGEKPFYYVIWFAVLPSFG